MTRMTVLPAAALAAALAAPAIAAATGALEGRVLRVFDGDSLQFQPAGDARPIEVRLKDIDAPESCQPGGPEAREWLAAQVEGQPVRLATAGRDTYGRTLAVLSVDGVNLNQRLVAEGHAWSLRSKWDRGPYVTQEKMAQALKRGVHATPGAVLPWDFRKSKGPCPGGPAAAKPK
jgi:micrococcal nuclease